ncbi:hypothetical protein WA852_31665, partial [Pseudomonas aeruginosa]
RTPPGIRPRPVARRPEDSPTRRRSGLLHDRLLGEGFSGNAGAAKQLLVRLRHDARVKVEVVDGTQVFVWLED